MARKARYHLFLEISIAAILYSRPIRTIPSCILPSLKWRLLRSLHAVCF